MQNDAASFEPQHVACGFYLGDALGPDRFAPDRGAGRGQRSTQILAGFVCWLWARPTSGERVGHEPDQFRAPNQSVCNLSGRSECTARGGEKTGTHTCSQIGGTFRFEHRRRELPRLPSVGIEQQEWTHDVIEQEGLGLLLVQMGYHSCHYAPWFCNRPDVWMSSPIYQAFPTDEVLEKLIRGSPYM